MNLAQNCEATVCYAAELAKRFGATLYVTHVFWPHLKNPENDSYLVDEQTVCRHQLECLTEHVRRRVSVCKSAFLVGDPVGRIAGLARDVDAHLIITTSDGAIFLSLTDAMQHAPCSVLVYQDRKNALRPSNLSGCGGTMNRA